MSTASRWSGSNPAAERGGRGLELAADLPTAARPVVDGVVVTVPEDDLSALDPPLAVVARGGVIDAE